MASTNAMDKAAAAFKKEEQRREGAKAMTEYLASQAAQEKKIEKLRALRLAQQTATAEAAALTPKPAAKPKARKKKLS